MLPFTYELYVFRLHRCRLHEVYVLRTYCCRVEIREFHIHCYRLHMKLINFVHIAFVYLRNSCISYTLLPFTFEIRVLRRHLLPFAYAIHPCQQALGVRKTLVYVVPIDFRTGNNAQKHCNSRWKTCI